MSIKEAKQNGKQISVKFDNSSDVVMGELIGFTNKSIYIKSGNYLRILILKNNILETCGYSIPIRSSDEIKMYDNNVGIKKKGSSSIQLYDENGKPAGTRSA